MDDLISTRELADAGSAVRVVDATLFLPGTARDARAEHETGHIPGATFLDLSEFADVPEAAHFAERMEALGIGVGDRIVVYDDSPLNSAARAWWLLRLFGARSVALLDGGIAKWKAEARPLESGVAQARSASFAAEADLGALARMADVANAGGAQIVDARSPGRFAGAEAEPRPGIAPGHIPGSRNLPQGALFAADGTWKRGEALRAAFTQAGVDVDRPMIMTCGSGVTAAVLSFGAQLLGARDVRLYNGSWTEWGSDPSTLKAMGSS